MLESYQEIVESFTSHSYFGNAHALTTTEEGVESCYYVELKPKYPENKHVQFATLWRLLQQHDPYVEYPSSSPNELQESLRHSFQYIIDTWNPTSADKSHRERVMSEMEKCQYSIDKNPKAVDRGTNNVVGYYLNSKYKAEKYPINIIQILSKQKPSLVLYEEWNDFMVVYEMKNVYSMFYWSTSA